MTKDFFCGMIVFVLISCGQGQSSDVIYHNPSILVEYKTSPLKTWPHNTELMEDFYKNEVDSTVYIVLEDREESRIGEIEQIFCFANKLIIVDRFVSKQILMYDINGKFIRKIGGIGRAQGEYVGIGHVYISDNTEIFVSDNECGKVLVYDSDGNFKREYILGINIPQTFCCHSENFLGAYAGFREDAPFRLVWFDMENGINETALPYTEFREYPAGNFIANQNETLCYFPMNDTIYRIKDKELSPFAVMNFYDNAAVEQFVKSTRGLDDRKYLRRLYTNANIINQLYLLRCDKKWLAYSQKGSRTYISVIGEDRRNYIRADAGRKSKVYIPDTFKTVYGNWLVGFINPEIFDYMDNKEVDKLCDEITKQTGVSKDALPYGNHIITMHRLKKDANAYSK